VLRLHDKLPRNWFHALQYLYVIPIYVFGIVVFWFGDFADMSTFYNYPQRKAPAAAWQWALAISGRLIFFSWYIGLHFWMFDFQKALFDCIVVQILIGLAPYCFFVVNHWTDKAALITNQELMTHTSDWAMLQILASTNFSINSSFWRHISGGLNLQIEHHLFPGIIHTRLPEITPVLRETCEEYGIRYDDQCYDSCWTALLSNLKFLKKLGEGLSVGSFPAVGKRKIA